MRKNGSGVIVRAFASPWTDLQTSVMGRRGGGDRAGAVRRGLRIAAQPKRAWRDESTTKKGASAENGNAGEISSLETSENEPFDVGTLFVSECEFLVVVSLFVSECEFLVVVSRFVSECEFIVVVSQGSPTFFRLFKFLKRSMYLLYQR